MDGPWWSIVASIFGDIIINVSKSINKEKQVLWRLKYIAQFDVPSVLIASRTGFLQFLLQTFNFPKFVIFFINSLRPSDAYMRR